MKIITGQVVNGKVELSESVADGTRVAVLAQDEGEEFVLTPAEERELETALGDIRSGSYVDGAALVRELRGNAAG